MIHADARTRDSIWMGVSLALSCLADPRVLDAVTPRPSEHFDPVEFLTGNGTLYLLATGAGAGASWALVAAFIEDLTETARRLAATSPGARARPAPAARPRRDRQPLPAPVAAGAHGRRRRHRHHHHARPPVTVPSTRQVGRPRSRRHLGRLHRQGHPRRNILRSRPPRPLRAHRRTRRKHRHHLDRRLRLTVAATLHPTSGRYCHPNGSARCPSEPRSCCCAARRRW